LILRERKGTLVPFFYYLCYMNYNNKYLVFKTIATATTMGTRYVVSASDILTITLISTVTVNIFYNTNTVVRLTLDSNLPPNDETLIDYLTQQLIKLINSKEYTLDIPTTFPGIFSVSGHPVGLSSVTVCTPPAVTCP